jgi:signal transduction histidine kinase
VGDDVVQIGGRGTVAVGRAIRIPAISRDLLTLAAIGSTLAAAVVVDASVKPRHQFVSSPFAVPILVAADRLPPKGVGITGAITTAVAAVAARVDRSPPLPTAFHLLGLGVVSFLAVLWGEQRRAIARQTLAANVEREEWVSMIAHDLRQPVTVITAYADRLRTVLTQRGSPGELACVEHILTSAGVLKQMIADLLDVSRIEARHLTLRRQPSDLPTLVRAVVERSAATDQSHPVRIVERGSIPLVEIDPIRVEQVLTNLLSNAAKYGYPDTEIYVVMERHDGYVEVSVANRGEGIPADELPRIFARFYRTRQARAGPQAGIGLGLTVARGLVEAQGGRIWAESVPGQMTTFHFTLPIAAGEADR